MVNEEDNQKWCITTEEEASHTGTSNTAGKPKWDVLFANTTHDGVTEDNLKTRDQNEHHSWRNWRQLENKRYEDRMRVAILHSVPVISWIPSATAVVCGRLTSTLFSGPLGDVGSFPAVVVFSFPMDLPIILLNFLKINTSTYSKWIHKHVAL